MRGAFLVLGLAAVVSVSCTDSNDVNTQPSPSASSTTTLASSTTTLGTTSSNGDDDTPPRFSDATWWLRTPPRAEHRELWLVVEERDCASGQSADDRTKVDVNGTETEIRLSVRVRAKDGVQACQGNPPTFVTVPLEQPVRERTVVGGGNQVNVEFGIDATEPLRRDVPNVLPVPVSETVVGHDAIVERLCTSPDGSEADVAYWEGTGAFPTAAHVVAAAIEHFELSGDGWHVVEFARPFGRDEQIWSQYHDGAPIAGVDVLPLEVGWVGGAAVCSLAPDGWQPDPTPAELFRDHPTFPAPPLDVADLLARAGAEQIDDVTWEFPNPNDRCPTWLRLQDEAHAGGYGIDAHDFGAWPAALDTADGTTTIDAELTLGGGRAATRIVTDGPLLHLETVVTVEVTGSEPLPCNLDSTATYAITDG